MTPAEHSHAELRDALILARRQLLIDEPKLQVPKPAGHGYRWTVATGVAAAVMILIGAVEFGGASSRPPLPPAPQVAEILQPAKPSAFAVVPQADPPVVPDVKQELEPEARPVPHKKRHHAPTKAAAKRTPHKTPSHKPKKSARTKKRSSPY
jgi:hypothetical protein